MNRRLCADAYVGVVADRRDPRWPSNGGPGPAVEYAVEMRRLPARHMLDSLLRTVRWERRSWTAWRVASRHSTPARKSVREVDQFGSIHAIRANWHENFEQIAPYVGRTISASRLDVIRYYVDDFLNRNADTFSQRQSDGRIRDVTGTCGPRVSA